MTLYFSQKEIAQLTGRKLSEFLELKLPEGPTLDYKQTMPLRETPRGERRRIKKEFLKDITSFANAQGGEIVIGVREPSQDMDIMEQVTGLRDAEGLARDLERLASTSVDPRIPALQIAPAKIRDIKEVVLVHAIPY